MIQNCQFLSIFCQFSPFLFIQFKNFLRDHAATYLHIWGTGNSAHVFLALGWSFEANLTILAIKLISVTQNGGSTEITVFLVRKSWNLKSLNLTRLSLKDCCTGLRKWFFSKKLNFGTLTLDLSYWKVRFWSKLVETLGGVI